MKNKEYMKWLLSIFIAISVSYGIIFAWSGVSGLTASPGETLTSSKWNQLVSIAETNSGKLTGVSNSNGIVTATAFVGDGSSLTNLPSGGSSTFSGRIKIGDDAGVDCDGSEGGAVRYNNTTKTMEFCNESSWGPFIMPAADGSSAVAAGVSCFSISEGGYSSGNHLYWIDPNSGSTDDAFEAYCDMTTDGGGRTLAVHINGDKAHHSAGAVGANPLNISTSYGKLSDADINLIKTAAGGLKFDCNGQVAYIDYNCTFRNGILLKPIFG